MSAKNSLITKIHVAKNQLAMSEDSYRELLNRITGQQSCAQMNITQLQSVLDEMVLKGFKAISKPGTRRMSPKSKGADVDKIRAIWITMHKHGFVRDSSEAALDSYVKRMTTKLNNGVGIDHVGWLKDENTVKVLESMKRWHRRLMATQLTQQGLTHLNGHRKSWPTAKAPYDYVVAAYEGQLL
ncbi:gp16 family protein [Alteromonas sp. AMM-1]|uniref:gp16 family protein n=1 Tax=Alteromonas sp. AMM-1 TaxID=3394233 RepID=UPI0039A4D7BC